MQKVLGTDCELGLNDTDFSFKLIDLGSEESKQYDDMAVDAAFQDYCDFWHSNGYDENCFACKDMNMDLG